MTTAEQAARCARGEHVFPFSTGPCLHCPALAEHKERGASAPPRATVAELGYFESVGRALSSLSPAQRLRVLTACLVAHGFEHGVGPETLAESVEDTSLQYRARIAELSSPGAYDGRGLLAYAFPRETP